MNIQDIKGQRVIEVHFGAKQDGTTTIRGFKEIDRWGRISTLTNAYAGPTPFREPTEAEREYDKTIAERWRPIEDRPEGWEEAEDAITEKNKERDARIVQMAADAQREVKSGQYSERMDALAEEVGIA